MRIIVTYDTNVLLVCLPRNENSKQISTICTMIWTSSVIYLSPLRKRGGGIKGMRNLYQLPEQLFRNLTYLYNVNYFSTRNVLHCFLIGPTSNQSFENFHPIPKYKIPY